MYIPLDVLILMGEFLVVGVIFYLACGYFSTQGYMNGVWEGSTQIINTLVERKIVSRDPKNGRILRYNGEIISNTFEQSGNTGIELSELGISESIKSNPNPTANTSPTQG